MSKAPDRCYYCKGDDPNCGFCDMGKPLDTQEDWDASWGKAFEDVKSISDRIAAGEIEEYRDKDGSVMYRLTRREHLRRLREETGL